MDYLQPHYEDELLSELAYKKVIGIDEVGRGAWAGPVAVGAYVYHKQTKFLEGINDSKKLKPYVREGLTRRLKKNDYTVWFAEPREIDESGIGKAIEQLIRAIIAYYQSPGTYFLIDGQFKSDFVLNSEKILKGDERFYSIALASIAAKVKRDKLMEKLHTNYPEYGFDRHKGYGTKAHREALKQHGRLENIHRVSYKPVKKLPLSKLGSNQL
mgnify:CR=1 FL=1